MYCASWFDQSNVNTTLLSARRVVPALENCPSCRLVTGTSAPASRRSCQKVNQSEMSWRLAPSRPSLVYRSPPRWRSRTLSASADPAESSMGQAPVGKLRDRRTQRLAKSVQVQLLGRVGTPAWASRSLLAKVAWVLPPMGTP